ncbi:MAG: class I SAM-dependent methyltransferase [Puniceicoccales bacterium]|jgi:predicted methyltransferase|nr:class I SAM-dependent methyltransferase [Puniceicoccales bacterium]
MRTADISLTQLAHARAAAALRSGDWAVDATAGNGHDTAFLAQAVGPTGHVFAFDVQQAALDGTDARLRKLGLADRVTLVHAGHETLAAHLPAHWRGAVAAVFFNLGYLPSAARDIITRSETTLPALADGTDWLRSGGHLSVLVYPAHPGGGTEAQDVHNWLKEAELRGEIVQPAYHGDPAQFARPWLFTGNKF